MCRFSNYCILEKGKPFNNNMPAVGYFILCQYGHVWIRFRAIFNL